MIESIARQIAELGPITFRDFMAAALYHPAHGYYASDRAQIGRTGDFFTNVSVGAIFGRMLSIAFYEMWQNMGRPPRFTIVEQGGNDGQFAADVLTAIEAEAPDFATTIDYCLIEPLPILRRKQQLLLGSFDQIRWCDSLESLEPFEGVHFSNELVDALPVHLLRRGKNEWLERAVDWQDGAFVWRELSIPAGALRDAAGQLPALPDGYECEVSLAALDWIDGVAAKLRRGFIVTIDYGFERAELYAPTRMHGTLRTISQHRYVDDPLQLTGQADITAHVDFTALMERGGRAGLECVDFVDQHHFLAGLLQRNPGRIFAEKERRGLQTLLNPTLLGMTFKVLSFKSQTPVDEFGGSPTSACEPHALPGKLDVRP